MKRAESAQVYWQDGSVPTASEDVPRVRTRLSVRDRLGHWSVRWGIRRDSYRVAPALYAVGSPDDRSPVLVTANFKMSLDRLRAQLDGRDAWILVLDTKGINVWCAAGKGTFGTNELIRRIEAVGLEKIVSHRKLVVPQLGATGVSAHEVSERSGWRVKFGPVRAEDLPAYLDAGMKATPEMRRVRFPFSQRVVLVPMELVGAGGYFLAAAAAFLLLSGLGADGYTLDNLREVGTRSVLLLLTAFLAGAAAGPTLLPWLPGRAFALKGAWAGLLATAAFSLLWEAAVGPFQSWMETVAWLLLGPAISSFLTMNFTGASTYTSLSGVRREMRVAVPCQIGFAAVGIVAWLAGRFI